MKRKSNTGKDKMGTNGREQGVVKTHEPQKTTSGWNPEKVHRAGYIKKVSRALERLYGNLLELLKHLRSILLAIGVLLIYVSELWHLIEGLLQYYF